MKKIKFGLAAASILLVASAAQARLNPIQMSVLEPMFELCGEMHNMAKSLDVENSTLLSKMLTLALESGATDLQLSILKMKFEHSATKMVIHLSSEDKAKAIKTHGSVLKESIKNCIEFDSRILS